MIIGIVNIHTMALLIRVLLRFTIRKKKIKVSLHISWGSGLEYILSTLASLTQGHCIGNAL